MTMRRIRLAVLAFAALAALVTEGRRRRRSRARGRRGAGAARRLGRAGAAPVELPRAALGAARGLPRAGIALTGPAGQRRAVPGETDYAFTWEFPTETTPSPERRRWGTEKLVLTLQCVLSDYGERHPEHARVGVADLSRPHGGSFGRRYAGGLGHSSHQNGLDADVLDPRWDLCECPAESWSDVDYGATQELIDAFVGTGAQYVFVSPSLYRRGLLRGPRGVVIPLRFHDTHMHVRIRP